MSQKDFNEAVAGLKALQPLYRKPRIKVTGETEASTDPTAGAQPGYLWVRGYPRGASVQVIAGPDINPRVPNSKVWVGDNHANQAVAFAMVVDKNAVDQYGSAIGSVATNPIPIQQATQPVPSELVGGGRVLPIDSPTPGQNVFVEAYDPALWSGAPVAVDPADFPTNPNEYCWAVFYFPPITPGTAVTPTYAVSPTRTLSSLELLPLADAAGLILPTSALRLFAVSLSEGQTDILPPPSSRWVDFRDSLVPFDLVSGSSPLTTKGDIFGYDTAPARVPIGTNGQIPVADSGQAVGWAWQSISAAGASKITVQNYGDTRPASPSNGDTVVLRNGFWKEVYHDGIWNPYKNELLLTTPPTASWSWDNQGGATIDFSLGAGYLFVPAGTSSLSLRLQYRSAPSTPYTITALIDQTLIGSTNPYVAIGFRESSSGKLHALLIQGNAANLQLFSAKFTDSSTFLASYTSNQFWKTGAIWLRITDNGTNRILSVSQDGKNFITFHTIGRTDFLTADQVFFGVAPSSATWDAAMTLYSWNVS